MSLTSKTPGPVSAGLLAAEVSSGVSSVVPEFGLLVGFGRTGGVWLTSSVRLVPAGLLAAEASSGVSAVVPELCLS